MDPICTHTHTHTEICPWFSSFPPLLHWVESNNTWHEYLTVRRDKNNWESTRVLLEIYSLIFSFSTLKDFCWLSDKKAKRRASRTVSLILDRLVNPVGVGDDTGKQLWHWRPDHWLNIIELYERCAVSLFVFDWFSDWLNSGDFLWGLLLCVPARPCVCASVCASTCRNINRAYLCIYAFFFFLSLPLCSNSLCELTIICVH